MKLDSLFYYLIWSLNKTERQAKYTLHAEILSGREAIDEPLVLQDALQLQLDTQLCSLLIVDSINQFKALAAQRSSMDKSVIKPN